MEGFSFVTPITGLNRSNTGKDDEEDDDDYDNDDAEDGCDMEMRSSCYGGVSNSLFRSGQEITWNAASVDITSFCDPTPRNSIRLDRCFRRAYCLHKGETSVYSYDKTRWHNIYQKADFFTLGTNSSKSNTSKSVSLCIN
jgi:hypothetical protein